MKKVKLGEVLSLKKGKKATVLAEQTTLSQRYIQIDDLRNNNNLKFTESLNMTEALPDDILIAWDGANAGTVGYGLSGAVGSTITVLKKNERYKEKIISDYLGVFLESKSQYLREHSTGATIPHLNKNILLDLQLELLGIEEQENIICILNTIKRLITKRKLQLDELNLLVKSRFNEMFGENKIFESIDNLFVIIHVLRNNNYSRVISGSAQPQLPITKLKKILLPLPPLALQNEFADFVAQVDKSQLAIQKSLEELETLKKSLMQEYFG
ncbi:type I restriction-modification system, S subunit, putative [Streptococcus pneumoniae]|nr:type I restriction-modification system, S subunit, putative [Streptococcus pneumoniae]